jgi:hypothetical protein
MSLPDLSVIDLLEALLLEAATDASTGQRRLLTVADVSVVLQLDPSWVYAHAHELGALRIGSTRRAPWRFDPRELARALRRLSAPPSEAAPAPKLSPRRRRRAGDAAANLLPVKPRLAPPAEL